MMNQQGATAKEAIGKIVGIWIPIWVWLTCLRFEQSFIPV